MPTCSFRDLKSVCQALGLEANRKKKGTSWEGVSALNQQLVQIVIHEHAEGETFPPAPCESISTIWVLRILKIFSDI